MNTQEISRLRESIKAQSQGIRYRDPQGLLKINCASGEHPLTGYINVDLYAPADVKDDMRTLSCFQASSADEIRCDHGLEHVLRDEVSPMLRRWLVVLKPGGVLRLDLPNLPEVIRAWLREYDRGNPEIWGWQTMTLFGRQAQPGDAHLWGYDQRSLTELLTQVGFAMVQVGTGWSHEQSCLLVTARK